MLPLVGLFYIFHRKTAKHYIGHWFLTFYARRTLKILNGLHGPLNHQADLMKDTIYGPKCNSYDLYGPL